MEDTFDKALLKVISKSGKEILKDKRRLVAYLADLAPECKKEVRIFSKNCSPELLRMFYSADGENEALQQQTISKARYILIEEEGLSEAWVDKMVNAVAYALGWKPDIEDLSVLEIEEEQISKEEKPIQQEQEEQPLQPRPQPQPKPSLAPPKKKSKKGLVAGLIGYLADLAPKYKKEARIFSRNCDPELLQMFHSADGGNAALQLQNGTVVAVGQRSDGQCKVGGWRDIVAVSCGDWHTVGLRKDGRVVAVGDNGEDQCDVEGWRDIVAVSCGDWHTVGLRKDGRVVAVGNDARDQCDVEDWRDIVAVSCGSCHTVAIKKLGN